ncbi:MAG: hypothetical protein COA94_09190 [Rickettsiales bacterium]|nr:MAG: hypothetical protein COA94_09190 [Rickettsiales bacterium]
MSVFILRGVSPKNVRNNYDNGHYAKMQPPGKISNTKLWKAPKVLVLKNDSRLTSFTTMTGSDKKIISLNNIESKCHNCGCECPDSELGIPIDIKRCKGGYIVLVIGKHCSYQCCFSDIIRESNLPKSKRDNIYECSEQFIRIMFKKQHPGRELTKANNWKIMETVGTKIFSSGKLKFIETGNVSIVRCEKEYVVMDT